MSRPMGVFKTENEYMIQIDQKVYADTPKAVLAAIVVSLLFKDGVEVDVVTDALLNEWAALNENGIVPQKPKRK